MHTHVYYSVRNALYISVRLQDKTLDFQNIPIGSKLRVTGVAVRQQNKNKGLYEPAIKVSQGDPLCSSAGQIQWNLFMRRPQNVLNREVSLLRRCSDMARWSFGPEVDSLIQRFP